MLRYDLLIPRPSKEFIMEDFIEILSDIRAGKQIISFDPAGQRIGNPMEDETEWE